MTASGTPTSARASASRIDGGVAPFASASSDASWITGPSITGSENGMPTSMPSAPAAATASIVRTHSPSPPVRYGTSTSRRRPDGPRARSGATIGGASQLVRQDVHHLGDVLVAPAGQVDQHRLPGELARAPASTQASAWAGSSAGMMPSVRASRLERVEHLGVGDLSRSGPGRCRRGGRARDRRPGSRARPRSTRPRAPARTRPASGTTASRARRRARRGRRRRRRPARRPTSSAAGVGEAGEDAGRVGAAADAGHHDVGHAAVEQRARTAPGPRRR